MPDFTVVLPDGTTMNLTEMQQRRKMLGKVEGNFVVVIHCWTSGDPKGMSRLNKIANMYRQDPNVLMLALQTDDDFESGMKVYEDNDWFSLIYIRMDSKQKAWLARNLGIESLPFTIVCSNWTVVQATSQLDLHKLHKTLPSGSDI